MILVHFIMRSDGFDKNRRLAGIFDEGKHNAKIVAAGAGPGVFELAFELVSLQCRGVRVGFEKTKGVKKLIRQIRAFSQQPL